VALLSESDRETVRAQLAGITHPVTLLFFTQTIGAPDSALLARQVLDEIADLNGQVSVEEVNFVLEHERAAAYGVDAIPAIAVLRDGQDTRIRFLGAPVGYEFVSLLQAVVIAGSDDSGLSESSRTLIAQNVTAPIDIQVFVTPT
jgi:alkyl hydroperoxide reductase subunit AhpF